MGKIEKLILLVAAVWVVLALVFAVTDLQISIAFVNPQSRWANFLKDYGERPGEVAYISAFCILVFSRFHLFGRKLIVSQRAVIFAKVTLGVTLLNVYLFVPLTKYFWGRVRFRDLDSSFSQYTAWYLPQGPNGNQSFTSGHTAEGWLLLPIGVILFAGRSRMTQAIVTALSIGWGIAVAVSRVRLGTHYASDVLFSSGVGITAFLLLYRRFSSRAQSNEAAARDKESSESPGAFRGDPEAERPDTATALVDEAGDLELAAVSRRRGDWPFCSKSAETHAKDWVVVSAP